MTDLSWMNDVSMDDLSEQSQANYREYKAAYAMMKEAKAKFENGMNAEAGLPNGKALVFNYRFGKLSVAIGEAKDKAATTAKAKSSLADFIAAQTASGQRA